MRSGWSWLAAAALAQRAPATSPALTYDVVSVKLNKSGSSSTGTDSSLDHFSGTNITLKDLIRYAYDLRSDDQIAGVPVPLSSTRFDLEAKVDADTLAILKSLSVEPRNAGAARTSASGHEGAGGDRRRGWRGAAVGELSGLGQTGSEFDNLEG